MNGHDSIANVGGGLAENLEKPDSAHAWSGFLVFQ